MCNETQHPDGSQQGNDNGCVDQDSYSQHSLDLYAIAYLIPISGSKQFMHLVYLPEFPS
jgi:hypothetical protein